MQTIILGVRWAMFVVVHVSRIVAVVKLYCSIAKVNCIISHSKQSTVDCMVKLFVSGVTRFLVGGNCAVIEVNHIKLKLE